MVLKLAPPKDLAINTSATTLLSAAHGLQRGETVLAFRARMEALAQLEAAMRAGTVSGTEAATQLHELKFPDSAAVRNLDARDSLEG